MKERTVLHLCSWFPNRRHWFEGNFIHKHIRTLEGSDYHNIAVAVFPASLKSSAFYEIEEGVHDRVPYFIIYHRPISSLINVLIRFSFYFLAIRKVKRKLGKVKLIHAHVFNYAGIFMYLYSLFYKIPYIVSEHHSFFQEPPAEQNVIIRYLIKKAARGAKYILPVSEDLKGRMQLYDIKGPFKVIPNVVNTNLFKPSSPQNPGANRLLHISSFHKCKNLPGILNVIKKLSLNRDDFTLTIAGDGDLEYVEKLIKSKDLKKQFVKVHGSLTEAEVAQMMQKHDYFILFSDYENLPCVLLEAQCCGMPIIATDVGGIREIVTEERFGVLINPGDEQGLLAAISQLLNEKNFDSILIRKKGLNEYSEWQISGCLTSVYEKVIK